MIKHGYIPSGHLPDESWLSKFAGVVVGSEYCVHLLPSSDELVEYLRLCGTRDLELTLQVPILKDSDLKKVVSLVRLGSSHRRFRVVVNDWGALYLISKMFPSVELVLGRLLSGQKCCVRLEGSPFLNEAGQKLLLGDFSLNAEFSSYLREVYRVKKISVCYTGREAGRNCFLQRIYHYPYVLVTVSDYCPVVGNRASFELRDCSRPCLTGVITLHNDSHRFPMLQRGKGKYFDPELELDEAALGSSEVILYEDVP